ncbi:SRPBCC family protein [Polaribacter aquimarinus]|uniref:GyrI-like small molecule binding domain-containing protein n=1 Tax=Polaribacter aquimarinus TaxID=2100726 RepID=A0A2U2J740_9FLAO|nr:SRPBCC family protein [Polaribacter aquimarinus]PWG04154.1 hypothetical protein DIS07_14405 [Polaribacter aquimarinus]
MKIFKKLLLFLVVVVVAAIIYASFQPADYDVSRSKIIKAPVSSVFNTVNDLKTWEKWGPWHDEDSTIVVTYGDKTVGVGASDSWTSKDGPGNMKTVKVVPNKLITQKMQFDDYEPSDIIWHFEEVEGGTKLTWQMKETQAPFMFKALAAFMGGWDKFFGGMMETGLGNLDKVVLEEEALANSFRVSDIKSQNFTTQKFIGYKVQMKINHEEMTKAFQEKMPLAGMYAMKSGLKYGEFTPAAVYTKYDEETQETEFYIGLILKKELKAGEGMTAINLPEGKGVMVSKFGNYGNGDEEAHIKIAKYLTTNKLEQRWPIWETYVNDPTMVKPQDIQTDIFYAVK